MGNPLSRSKARQQVQACFIGPEKSGKTSIISYLLKSRTVVYQDSSLTIHRSLDQYQDSYWELLPFHRDHLPLIEEFVSKKNWTHIVFCVSGISANIEDIQYFKNWMHGIVHRFPLETQTEYFLGLNCFGAQDLERVVSVKNRLCTHLVDKKIEGLNTFLIDPLAGTYQTGDFEIAFMDVVHG